MKSGPRSVGFRFLRLDFAITVSNLNIPKFESDMLNLSQVSSEMVDQKVMVREWYSATGISLLLSLAAPINRAQGPRCFDKQVLAAEASANSAFFQRLKRSSPR